MQLYATAIGYHSTVNQEKFVVKKFLSLAVLTKINNL